MAQARYKTPVDANFISAYEMYNHQVEEVDRAHLRNRRSDPAWGRERGRSPPVPEVRQTNIMTNEVTDNSNGVGLKRYAISSVLIGYTAAMFYFMAVDGPSAMGATRM